MTTDTFKIADAAFRRGDPLCDAHLSLLLTRYRAAVKGLDGVYSFSYALVMHDLQSNLDRLEMFQRNRRKKD